MFPLSELCILQVGEDRHVGQGSLKWAMYLNHACDANVAIQVPGQASLNNTCPSDCMNGNESISKGISPETSANEPNEFFVVAMQDIAADEEVRFNYLTTEYSMAECFTCWCGSPTCFGRIEGFSKLPRDKQLSLRPYLSPYLRSLLDSKH